MGWLGLHNHHAQRWLYDHRAGRLFQAECVGLSDVIGNVFEYTSNPQSDPGQYPPTITGRGGSWWCSPHACNFHNLMDIGRMLPNVSISNQGFRVARDL